MSIYKLFWIQEKYNCSLERTLLINKHFKCQYLEVLNNNDSPNKTGTLIS